MQGRTFAPLGLPAFRREAPVPRAPRGLASSARQPAVEASLETHELDDRSRHPELLLLVDPGFVARDDAPSPRPLDERSDPDRDHAEKGEKHVDSDREGEIPAWNLDETCEPKNDQRRRDRRERGERKPVASSSVK